MGFVSKTIIIKTLKMFPTKIIKTFPPVYKKQKKSVNIQILAVLTQKKKEVKKIKTNKK